MYGNPETSPEKYIPPIPTEEEIAEENEISLRN
jgi:hypothetical protein